jgi:rod shape-determining protein MreC
MFFKNYRTVIFVGALVVAAIVLLSYSLTRNSGACIVKNLVLEAAAPVQKVFISLVEGVENAWKRYIYLVGLTEENRHLKKEISGLQTELMLYKEGYLESQRLQKLLSLQNEYPFKFIAARVIGREQAALLKSLWIDKGSSSGLASGMAVIAQPGVVGRLTDVSFPTSRVLLLSDENSNVDVLVQRTRAHGIARGAGARGCTVRYISKIDDVKPGDLIMTSGLSNIFPKGLLVGRVSSVDHGDVGLFLQIRVIPFVNFSTLEEILVVAAEQRVAFQGKKPVK